MPDFGSMMLTNDMHFTINSLFVPYLYNSRFFISFSYDRRDLVWANIQCLFDRFTISHAHSSFTQQSALQCFFLFYCSQHKFRLRLSVWVRIYVKCCSFFFIPCPVVFLIYHMTKQATSTAVFGLYWRGSPERSIYTVGHRGNRRGGKMRWKMRHDNNKIYFLWPFPSLACLLARRRCRDEILFCLFKRRFSFALSTKS